MNGKYIDAAMLLLKNGSGGGESPEIRRELDLLWKLTHGTIWDTETDSDPGYAKTVPSGAVAVEIGTIGGNTVMWNQAVTDGGNPESWTNSTYLRTSSEDGVLHAYTNTSSTRTWSISQNAPINAGHTYLVSADSKAYMKVTGSDKKLRINLGDNVACYLQQTIDDTQQRHTEAIYTVPDDNVAQKITVGIGAYTPDSGSDIFDISNLHVIDLTMAFGAGNEPSSVDDPRIAVILSYAGVHPEYNAGVLLSAAVTSVVSKDTDTETLDTLEIPAAVRALEGYGQSEIGGSGNVLDLSAGTYTENGHYVDGVWTALDTPVVTDVSALLPDNMLDAEAGGTLTFVQDGGMTFSVPNSVDYLIKISEVTE